MEAGEINKCVRGQEEVGDDGGDDVQLRCKRSRTVLPLSSESVCVCGGGGWTALKAWELNLSWKSETAKICQSLRS